MADKLTREIIRVLDETMPGRRIGSMPPPDWTAQALADLERLYPLLPASLGLRHVQAFAAEQSLPADERYLKEFRRQALLRRMREASHAAR